jgi:tetratricopeptide (TPR) repeat protein
MQIQKDTPQALSWADVEKLFQPETEGRERQEIVRRLVSRAARNARQETSDRTLWGTGEPVPIRDQYYEDALRRAVEGMRQAHERLAQEKRDADRLWNLLEGHTPARRGILIRNDRRFQTWGLYECLRERAQALLEREPGAAVQSAELSLVTAQSLSPALYGEERVHDFQAEALIALGQARRVAGDLEGAGTALDQARVMLAMGTGDLLEKAELESARAALLHDLGRPEEAEEAGRKALRLAHLVGGPKRDGRLRDLDDTAPHLRRRRRMAR